MFVLLRVCVTTGAAEADAGSGENIQQAPSQLTVSCLQMSVVQPSLCSWPMADVGSDRLQSALTEGHFSAEQSPVPHLQKKQQALTTLPAPTFV